MRHSWAQWHEGLPHLPEVRRQTARPELCDVRELFEQ